ncbi:uncharacterized protein LOC129591526 [Paramacrobiotus metropolitanus]|uniref:uncharacterized protein LOC129591526 n=1 Tax=Paramacrobiotus metropolitanus TaxID=2943436 RepID=UPI002445A9CF|nr:uncharacterized protein LOC129591526 [Paramacrobiotus metropolitanus]
MKFLQILTVTFLLSECSLSLTIDASSTVGSSPVKDKTPGPKAIRHSVIVNRTHPEEQHAVMQLLLDRWKTVLSEKFGLTATGMYLLNEEAKSTTTTDQRIITYEVDFTMDDTAASPIAKAHVIEALNKSLKEQPLAGVTLRATPQPRKILIDCLLDCD